MPVPSAQAANNADPANNHTTSANVDDSVHDADEFDGSK